VEHNQPEDQLDLVAMLEQPHHQVEQAEMVLVMTPVAEAVATLAAHQQQTQAAEAAQDM
jgi:hypothetical protein